MSRRGLFQGKERDSKVPYQRYFQYLLELRSDLSSMNHVLQQEFESNSKNAKTSCMKIISRNKNND